MRNVILAIHHYDDLDEAGQKAARGWFRRTLDEDFYFESLSMTDSMIQTLQLAGYPVPDSNKAYNVQWSLSCSQGDGVGFGVTMHGGETLELIRRIRGDRFAELWERIADIVDVSITVNQGRSYYVSSVDVEIESGYNAYPAYENMAARLETEILNDCRDMCRQLEKDGYAEIDYQYSRETIEDNIRSNEYEFTVDGKPWPR